MTEITKKRFRLSEEKKKVKIEGKRFKVAGRVVTETNIYVQVVVSFAHKNCQISTNASTRCGYVLSGQSQAQRAASLCAATLHVFL